MIVSLTFCSCLFLYLEFPSSPCSVLRPAGVIPASFTDQQAAQRLAVCNDIGEASYIDSLIAASLLDTLTALPSARSLRRRLAQRYDVEFSEDMTGAGLSCACLPGGSCHLLRSPLAESISGRLVLCNQAGLVL